MSKYLGICRIITRGTVTFAPIVPGRHRKGTFHGSPGRAVGECESCNRVIGWFAGCSLILWNHAYVCISNCLPPELGGCSGMSRESRLKEKMSEERANVNQDKGGRLLAIIQTACEDFTSTTRRPLGHLRRLHRRRRVRSAGRAPALRSIRLASPEGAPSIPARSVERSQRADALDTALRKGGPALGDVGMRPAGQTRQE